CPQGPASRRISAMRRSCSSAASSPSVSSSPVSISSLSSSATAAVKAASKRGKRSEEHTSELQSRENLVCRLLLEKKNKKHINRKLRRSNHHPQHLTRQSI